MKKLAFFLVLLSVGLFSAACSDNDSDGDTPSSSLQIVKSEVNFDAAGGEGSIEVSAPNNNYTAVSSHDSWCHITLAGAVISVQVDPFSDLASRTAVIQVGSGGNIISVPVTQQGAIVSFPADVEIIKQPTAPTIVDVQANASYTATVPADYSSWLSCTQGDGEVTITATTNPSVFPRVGKVTFTRDNGVESAMTVTQDGGTVQEIYNALIGTNWTMKSRSTIAGSYTTRTDVKIEQNTSLVDYKWSNLSNDFATAPFTLNFSKLGKVTLKYKYVGQYGNANYPYLFQMPCGPAPGTTTPIYILAGTALETAGYEAFAEVIDNTTIQLKFTDNGGWVYPVRGFSALGYATIARTTSSFNFGRFLDVTLTKPL